MKNNLAKVITQLTSLTRHDDVPCGLEFEFIKNKKFIIPYIYCIQKVIFTTYE